MGGRLKAPIISVMALSCLAVAVPARSQTASHGLMQNQQPSEQQIRRFCANYGQLSGSQRKQYRDEYKRYCESTPTFGQPVEPEQAPSRQQPSQQQQQPQQPEPEPTEPDVEPEPEIQPAEPEPALLGPEPLRVDLAGALRLEGPLARQAGERQGFRVEIRNLGEDSVPGGRLWARVFLSDRDPSRRGLDGALSLPAVQHGQRVRIAGVPGPGQSREVMAQVTLPTTVEAGQYLWCLWIDERRAIEETDEDNNFACARKAVAIGEDRDSGSGLSGLFGSKVDALQTNEAIAEETGVPDFGELIASLPADVQPAVERMSTLFVNGSLTPARVPEGGTAEVTWEFSPGERPDGLWLMIGTGTLDGSDCSGDLASRFGGHPDAGRYAPDGDPVELSLEHYRPGFRYKLIGCYWRDGFFTGDWTNLVSFQYGAASSLSLDTTPDPREEAESVIEEALEDVVKPDLVVDMVSITPRGSIVFAVENTSDNLDRWQRWARTYYASRDAGAARTPPVHMLGDQPLYSYTYRVFIDDERVSGDGEGGLAPLGDDRRPLLAGIRDVARTDIKIPADGRPHDVRVVVNPDGHDTPFPYEESSYSNNAHTSTHAWETPVTLRLDLEGLEMRVERTGDTVAPGELQLIELRLCQVGGGCSHTGEDSGIRKGGGSPQDRVDIYVGTTVSPTYGTDYLELRNVMPSNRFYLSLYAYDHDDGVGANRGEGGFSRFEFEFPPDMLTDAIHSDRRCAGDHWLQLHGGTIIEKTYSGASKGPHLLPKNASVCVYRSEDP